MLEDRLFVWGRMTDADGRYHSQSSFFSVDMLTGEVYPHNVTPSDTLPPCEGACSAAIGNTIYSYGGKISWSPYKTSDELYNLNLEDMKWRRVEATGTKPEARFGAGMCRVNGKLLLMGGYGPLPSERKHPQAEYKESTQVIGHGRSNDLFEFDPQTGEYISRQVLSQWAELFWTSCQRSISHSTYIPL